MPLLAVEILHRHVTVHPRVNVQVQLTSDSELPDVHLQRVPVATVEWLPLGRGVQVPEGRTLLATVDKVGLGHHVTARQELHGFLQSLLGQLGRVQDLRQRVQLRLEPVQFVQIYSGVEFTHYELRSASTKLSFLRCTADSIRVGMVGKKEGEMH